MVYLILARERLDQGITLVHGEEAREFFVTQL
jgi:hypothetical protein